jgi:hypothetical protein
MTKIYQDRDLWNAVMQRRKILGIFIGVSVACFLALAGFVAYYVMLPYQDPNTTWVTAVSCVIVGLYLMFAFPYMGISFKRCNAYCKMLKFISVGRKESATLPFEGIDDWTTHDGVDVNVGIFSVRNIKRDETMRRQIYVDGEKDFPAFEEGKTAKLVSQGNLLIEYELSE